MMMQPNVLQQYSWPFYDVLSSICDDQVDPNGLNMYSYYNLTNRDETSEVFSEPFPPFMFSNGSAHYQFDESPQPQTPPVMDDDFFTDLEETEPILFSANCGYLEEQEASVPPQQYMSSEGDAMSPAMSIKSDLSSANLSLILPGKDVEIDNRLILYHLLMAYGEAIEKGQKELRKVLLRCICEKVNPLGGSLERLAFILSQEFQDLGDYIMQEALKDFQSYFKVFYQHFPHAKFAHFAANSVIFEGVPDYADGVHVVDFDMGEGVQWPPIIEAIAHRKKTIKLTSIKWEEEEGSACGSSPWRFEDIRKQLMEYARSYGLNLIVEEKGIEVVMNELIARGGRSRDWLVFNCMVGLPHMRRARSRRLVMKFLDLAKGVLSSSIRRGIITFGDADPCERLKNCLNFRSFFEGHVVHYKALLESIESNFPVHLTEARTAMESLFVAPHVNVLKWLQKWEDTRDDCRLQLQGLTLRKEILMEAKEMVKEKEGSYEARIEGYNGNEMVLEWKGCPLIRVSAWGI